MAEFAKHSDELLYGILPRIREIDPQWAKRLEERSPAVAQASSTAGKIELTENFTIQDSSKASPDQIRALQQRGLQASRLNEVERIAPADPERALSLSNTLTESLFQVAALAAVAANLAASDPVRARALINSAKDKLQLVAKDVDKVTAWTAIARAAAATNDVATLREALRHGFDLGEEVFEEDADVHPGRVAYELAGFDDLCELTRIGVMHDTENTLSRVANSQNPVLQDHLLIDGALALYKLHNSEPSSPR